MEQILAPGLGRLAVAALILAALALGGVAVLLVQHQRLLSRYRRMMVGSSGGNLEALLGEWVDLLRSTASRAEELDRRAGRLEEAGVLHVRHLAVLRYNPFHDTGGDQSFAVAMADGRGNGVVLSSLHARDTTRVYAKPLEGWSSPYALTDEEKEAISLARQGG